MTNATHVQFGCGHCAPPTWRNFDASPTLRFERVPVVGRLYSKNARRFPPNVEYGDILRGLPVAPGSCDAMFSSHVLQDLTLEQSRTAIRHAFALLRPGGVYRTVVPDLMIAVRRYVESDDPLAAYAFLRETKTGVATTLPRRAKVAAALGSRQQWQWDFPTLAHELRAAGFTAVRRCEIGDAVDPRFADVEDPTRFREALAVECARP
ncbi:MAG TPA: methyltransferase domain-containing protein [Gemmatirosa sp.]